MRLDVKQVGLGAAVGALGAAVLLRMAWRGGGDVDSDGRDADGGSTGSALSAAMATAVAMEASATGCSPPARSPRPALATSDGTRPAIVLLGDSITQFGFRPGGWAAMVADKYQRTADVVQRGFSGYTTRWALRVVPSLFPPEGIAPLLVIVFLGANDACRPAPLKGMPVSASRQHVPVDEYRANLRKIVHSARSVGDGSSRVLLVTPPPVDGAAWLADCVTKHGAPASAEPNRDLPVTLRYAEAAVATGRELSVPTLDLCTTLLARDDWQALFYDGLHPNAAGSTVIGEAMLQTIEHEFPELTPSWFLDQDPRKLRMDFPDHKAIDAESGTAAAIDASFAAHARAAQAARS